MTRKRIQAVKGAIAPTSRPIWFSALEKLHEAEAAIVQMRNAQDRIAYEAGWTRFVDSLEEFWVRFFDEGKAAFPAFQPWAGAIDAQRKGEDLLKYLYQARHQSQHGRIAMQWEEPKLMIAPSFNGHIRALRAFPDGTYEIDATPLHPTLPDAIITHDPGKPRLPTIENKKYKQSFSPPTSFRGQRIHDPTPLSVAQLGLGFYSTMLSRALEKFVPPEK
jgi:hypothetical protein